MKKATIDPSKLLILYFRVKRAGSKKFIFVNSSGSPIDITSYNFQLWIQKYAGAREKSITLSVGTGLTIGGTSNNELTATFTSTDTNINEGEYFWELYKGSTEKTYLNGPCLFHNGNFDGVETDEETITINDVNQIVTITINDSGGSTSTDTASNGLYKDGTTFKLGGSSLEENTAIGGGGMILNLGESGNELLRLDVFASDNINLSSTEAVNLAGDNGINLDSAGPVSATGSSFNFNGVPIADQNYVNNRLAGIKWKNSAVVATTVNITLSGEQTIDGVLTNASRVLVKNQSTGSQNGIYVSSVGAWSRATDADSASELQSATISIDQGTSNANTTWLQTADSITIGSTSLTWEQFGSSVPDASPTTKGIAKLYTSTGSNTDGSMDQNSITSFFQSKITGLTANRIIVATSGTTIGDYAGLGYDPTTKALYVGISGIGSGSTGIRIHQGTIVSNNTFVGHNSANSTLTGDYNSFFGAETGIDVTSASWNTVAGYAAADVLQTGGGNSLFGFAAGQAIVNGDNNTISGYQSSTTLSGSNNSIYGSKVALNAGGGSNNVAMGYNIDLATVGGSNQLNIQNIIYGINNSGTLGTVSTGSIGIGVKSPDTKLHIDGELRLGTTSTSGDQTISVASSTTNANLILTPQGTGSVRSRFTGVPTSTLAGLDFGSFAGIPSAIANGQAVYNTNTNEAIVRINGVNTAINKATQLSGILPIANGGTNLSALGSPGQSLVVNAGGTALEYQTVAGGSSWATTGNTNITTPTITGVPTFIGYNIIQTDALATTQTNTSGLVLDNTTAAVVGTQAQYSPALRFRGRGYVTGGGTSQTVDMRLDNYTVPGTSAASGNLRISKSINGAAYTDEFFFGSDGSIFIGSSNGSIYVNGAAGSLTCQSWFAQNSNLKFSLRLPTGAVSTGLEFTATAGNINSLTYTGLKYTGGTYAPATSTGTHTTLALNPVYNTTGSFTGTAYGIDYNPTLTSTTGLTHIAARFVTGDVLIGGSTITASTKLDVIGNVRFDGNVTLASAGNGLKVKEGTNATLGTATLSGGTVTVSTTKVTTSSRIFVSINGGTLTNVGSVYEDKANRTAGTSFIIKSTNILDAADVIWFIIEPAS